MREPSSCTPCRSRKKRCVPLSASGDRCRMCHSKRVTCDLARVRQGRNLDTVKCTSGNEILRPALVSLSATASSGTARARSSSPQDILHLPVCDELVDLYFDVIHNKQQILFQRRAFVDDRRAGRVPEYLLLGMVALVSRCAKLRLETSYSHSSHIRQTPNITTQFLVEFVFRGHYAMGKRDALLARIPSMFQRTS